MVSPLPSEHCEGPVAVGRYFGHVLACGVFGMSSLGYAFSIPPGRCMYLLHLIGPELPTRLGMQSISAWVMHYTQEEYDCIFCIHHSNALELVLAR